MLKLIIWDLDDTLWRGTLAEGDQVELLEGRMQAIRRLNQQGVVHSICSKNDYEKAKAKLEDLGVFDEFVFPEINFAPKGMQVQKIISDMNLRAPDVVFVDDNPHNLHEVASVVEGIVTYNANSTEFDEFLDKSIVETLGGKSRLEKYRIMEAKRSAREVLGGTNEDFLRASDVRMTVVRTQENFPFAERIEELVNRTNQLNFLKTRIEPGTLAPFIVDLSKNQVYSVFVWDRFGSYGLVGFAFVRANSKELRHFTFSCRIMNMGIEEQFAWFLSSASDGPRVPARNIPISAVNHDWITMVNSSSDEARSIIASAMGASDRSGRPEVRIMANCQSGSIAHYLDLKKNIEVDNWPQAFRIGEWADDRDLRGSWAPEMVYGAFVDYQQERWASENGLSNYFEAASDFVDQCANHDSRLTVLLPVDSSENSEGVYFDYRALNQIWRQLAKSSPHVEVIELSDHISQSGVDARHFTRETFISMAEVLSSKLA